MDALSLVSRLLGLPLFPQFKYLPKELRDAIWEYAALQPRIVPLCRCKLRMADESPGPEEVTGRIIDHKTDEDLGERGEDSDRVANKTMLEENDDTTDDTEENSDESAGENTGESTSETTNENVEQGSERAVITDRNEGHWAFKCGISPPAVLFVNHESYEAARRVYTPNAFPCIRGNNTSAGETCINFERDTLYLDVNWTLQIHYRATEMARVERDKVKNVAMICAGDWDPSFAEELAGRECISENELWLSQFLAYFVNVETVTCVLEHAACPKYEEKLASKERALVFTDEPVDVSTTLEVLESKTGTTAIPTHPRFMSFDMDLLRERRSQRRSELPGEEDEPTDWPLPKIEQKVMLSAGLKAVLDEKLKRLSLV